MKPRHIRRGQTGRHPALKAALLIAGLLLASVAWAGLPPPTPAQQQAAADKKAKADAQAAKDKISLTASMDAVTTRWRARAAEQGWKAHPAVAVAAAPPAAAAPAVTTAAGPAAQPAPGTPPAGAPAAAPAAPAAPPFIPPIKSEKLGTAPPSEDVKKTPTKAQPRSMPPTVDKGTPDVKNK
jgi:colicin import membrane protein